MQLDEIDIENIERLKKYCPTFFEERENDESEGIFTDNE